MKQTILQIITPKRKAYALFRIGTENYADPIVAWALVNEEQPDGTVAQSLKGMTALGTIAENDPEFVRILHNVNLGLNRWLSPRPELFFKAIQDGK